LTIASLKRFLSAQLRCTSDEQAAYKLLEKAPLQYADCPDLGASVSFRVAASSEHALALANARAKGPAVFNGLRACREFVHGAGK
jgi:hypothetical protein